MVPDESLKKVVQLVDHIATLISLQNRIGHIGMGKLYSLECGLYEWMYLLEDCISIVKGWVGYQTSKAELQDLLLKLTSEGRRSF